MPETAYNPDPRATTNAFQSRRYKCDCADDGSTPSDPPAEEFDVLADLPWESLWIADDLVAVGDGVGVENWPDAVAGTSVITQATVGKRPIFRLSDALFNGHSCIEGEKAAARSMQWTRGSALVPPYTVVIVGVMPAKVLDYQTFVSNAGGIESMWPWDSFDVNNSSEMVYINGASREFNARSAAATIWHTGMSATTSTHRIGRNGISAVPAAFAATNFGGFSLFRYPTSDNLHGSGKIAFLGVAGSMLMGHANWPAFLSWVQSYYGVVLTTRANIICDNASKARGYQFLDNTNHGDKMWPHVLETSLTNPVAIANVGVNSRTMAVQIADAATRITPVVAELVTNKKIVIDIAPALNDIAAGTSSSAAYQLICDYVRDRHGEGFLVLIATNPSTGSFPQEANRIAVNALLMANAGDGGGGASSIADGIVDIANDADTSAGNPFAWANPTTPHTPANWNADLAHWSTTGNAVVAGRVKTALAAAPFSLT